MIMSIQKLLLWEKWRPKKMEDIILLPRIEKHFKDGVIDNHYIFYGNYGTGKTSLARILMGLYTKDKAYLEINCSLETSIDVLRNEVENFCKFRPMMEVDSEIKCVFLDEFDGVSRQYQDAFKAFIEKYSKNGVRFIITTNYIDKIGGGSLSRIPRLDFDCQDLEEEKILKRKFYKRIKDVILVEEGQDVPKDELISIINKNFPDFRATLVQLESYIKTGDSDKTTSSVSIKVKLDLYNMIYEQTMDYEQIYHFLMTNFGADKIHEVLKLLGRPFINWSLENKKNIDKLFKCNYIISEYSEKLESNTDPIVLGMTVVGKFRDILLFDQHV